MSPSVAYLDSSAFVKLVVAEAESAGLRRWLGGWAERASCALLRVEAIRAVRPAGPTAVRTARYQMARINVIEMTRTLLDSAANLGPPLRSLDAIHIAAAQSLGSDLGVVVTYDSRMAEAARSLGLAVAAPD
jgi:predicted nucleic acid-binding protein